jgi:hypothetical protein
LSSVCSYKDYLRLLESLPEVEAGEAQVGLRMIVGCTGGVAGEFTYDYSVTEGYTSKSDHEKDLYFKVNTALGGLNESTPGITPCAT